MQLVDHLEKLKYFNKLYNFKSLKEASKVIGISQVGLSKSIAILENILGTPLLVRTPRGIQFTSDGRKLYQFSAELIEKTLSIQSELQKKQGSNRKIELTLVTYDSIAVYFLPDLAEYLGQVYPSLKLNLRVDHSRNICEKLNSQEIDLAVAANINSEALGNAHAHYVKLFQDSYGFYINKKLINTDYKKLPLIYHPLASDSSGKTCTSYLEHLLESRRTVMSENFETVKSMTLSGLGIGVLPQNVARTEFKTGRLLKISMPRTPSSFGVHEIGIAYSKTARQKAEGVIADIIRIGKTWTN